MTMKAIETTGIIDKKHQIKLDRPVPLAGNSKVRIIILFSEENDIDEREWLQAASNNPAFDFLREPEEDVYTQVDGKPFNDKE